MSIRVADELRQLEYSQRLRDRARNVIGAGDGRSTGRVLFEGAVRGGAQALGVTGAGIAAGARADFFSLSAMSPRSNIVATMRCSTAGSLPAATTASTAYGARVASWCPRATHKRAAKSPRAIERRCGACSGGELADLRYSSVDTGITVRILARAEGD